MHILEDIDGITVARASSETPSITLLAASGFNDKGFYPAESVTLTGLSSIAALRDVCERLIEAHLEDTQVTGEP